jgi:hypothetical protein
VPSDTAVVETPDEAQADAIRRDPFSAEWLQDSELTSPPGIDSGWPDQAEAEPSAAAEESWFTPRDTVEREQVSAAGDTEALPVVATWFSPRERSGGDSTLPAEPGALAAEREALPAEPGTLAAEREALAAEPGVVAPQEYTAEPAVTGFWTPSAAASATTEVQRPGALSADVERSGLLSAHVERSGLPSAEDRGVARASWTAPAEIADSDPPAAATVPAQAATPSRTTAGPAVSPAPTDRLYPARLLVVIVVAALIGSILVLLLR